jgi:fructuronate reductase
VVQDSFAAGRPAWEKAGALFTDDVTPYETMKLRLLNGTHSLLAYLGALAGYETIAQAVADPALAEAAASLMSADAASTLRVPKGLDVVAYQRSVLNRFANPALRHRTVQVASDGSQKLPIRLLGTARDRLAAGKQPRWVALAVAGWLLYVAHGADRRGRQLPLDDPLALRLCATLVPAARSASAIVDAGLSIHEVFPPELAADKTFRALLIDAVEQLVGELRLRPPR